MIRDVGLAYAEKSYFDLRRKISVELERDVLSEIENVARMYRQFIVGVGGERARQAVLKTNVVASTTASGRQNSAAVASLGGLLPEWAPRGKRYLRWKRRKYGHARWFENDGYLGEKLSKGSTWQAAFGPVNVRVIRTAANTGNPQATQITDGSAVGSQIFSVAKIEVRAFTDITAQMLPALITGRLEFTGIDGRKSGLLSGFSSQLQYRLGGRVQRYRPTLEPFLGFALTRAIPAAVFQRIQRSTGGRLNTDTTVQKTYRPR